MQENLNAIYAAQNTFIAVGNQKSPDTQHKNTGKIYFVKGDTVFYKTEGHNDWGGLEIVT